MDGDVATMKVDTIPEELRDSVQEAVNICPIEALTVEETGAYGLEGV